MDEQQPVIRIYFAKMKDAFERLPEEERAAFMRKDRENLDELGMKAVAMIDCRSWNGEWDYVGVEQWPSMAAIDQRVAFEKDELEVDRYVESKTLLGTEISFEDYGREVER